MGYNFTSIEKRWQQYWLEHRSFRALDPAEAGNMPKAYVLDMFPYPSGAGLHVGHPEGYTATDIVSRFLRMKGYNVLHPMGWDAFGLPAEQYAIKTNTHPRKTTEENIRSFRRQIQMLGLSYDWDREVDTTDPAYYRWTQWIFLQIYNSYFDKIKQKAMPIGHLVAELQNNNYVVAPDGSVQLNETPEGLEAISPAIGVTRFWHELSPDEQRGVLDGQRLAYTDEVPVNWCPGLGTVLSNEEVIDGKSDIGDFPVERRPMRQWMLRITAFADRLLGDLDQLNWPDSLKEMQRNWIGRSVGADVDFAVPDLDEAITVFTTRPDTLYGATYMVLAPEHELVDRITTDAQRRAIEDYRAAAAAKSERERQEGAKDKTGVFTGGYAINPVNDAKIPVWIADYVLMGYGTGAIMAVPAHDDRDFEFAKKFDLPIRQVVKPLQGSYDPDRAYCDDGVAVNSPAIDGLPTAEAKEKIIALLAAEGAGRKRVNYKLRDWLFSRQRYWGEPFPIVLNESGDHFAIGENELPLELPEMEDFKPTGTPEPPLSKAREWLVVEHDGGAFRRETNTMPQWAGSCWYYLRYIDPKNDKHFVDPAKEKYWMPVDLYVGGVEHAVLHLLYARFWHKVLFDLGHVSTSEPFKRLVNQGLILGEDSQKMSKSRGNVVNPDDIVEHYGADCFRLYEMYMGPLEAQKPWSTRDIVGMTRFLNAVWRHLVGDEENNRVASIVDMAIPDDIDRQMHRCIKKVADDIEHLRFNTAIAELIKLNNEMARLKEVPKALADNFVLMLAPFAPHIAEEIWHRLGHTQSLARHPWPKVDAAKLVDSEIELPVQVNGKLRDRIVVSADADEATVFAAAENAERVKPWIEGKSIRKKLYVPKKLVNLVVS